ncbi:MAG TPA: hypothetical protein VJH34_02920 [archaeon]|nr:hypothetical protein [archaeon]
MAEKTKKLCGSCTEFVGKHEPWDGKKVPKVAVMDSFECQKCRMSYDVYKGMVNQLPLK